MGYDRPGDLGSVGVLVYVVSSSDNVFLKFYT